MLAMMLKAHPIEDLDDFGWYVYKLTKAHGFEDVSFMTPTTRLIRGPENSTSLTTRPST